jgi:hypothetical protein
MMSTLRTIIACAVVLLPTALVPACERTLARSELQLHVDVDTGDARFSGDRLASSSPLGELRGAYQIRISADGLQPLILRTPEDPGEDLLPILTELHALDSERALASGFVSFGGGVASYTTYLVGERDGALAILDQLVEFGCAFLEPCRFEPTPTGGRMMITPCAGMDCVHRDACQPTELRTRRWSVEPEEFVARHLGGEPERTILILEDHFECERPSPR